MEKYQPYIDAAVGELRDGLKAIEESPDRYVLIIYPSDAKNSSVVVPIESVLSKQMGKDPLLAHKLKSYKRGKQIPIIVIDTTIKSIISLIANLS